MHSVCQSQEPMEKSSIFINNQKNCLDLKFRSSVRRFVMFIVIKILNKDGHHH
jgi:hypothetical protein